MCQAIKAKYPICLNYRVPMKEAVSFPDKDAQCFFVKKKKHAKDYKHLQETQR